MCPNNKTKNSLSLAASLSVLGLIASLALLAGCGSTGPGITADNPPSIQSFTVSPQTANGGQQVTLAWQTSNATSVNIDHGVGTGLAASGSRTIAAPSSTTTFTLTAMGSGNRTATATAVLQVSGPPTIQSFTVSPQTANAGQQVTLAWQTSNATSVNIDHGVGTGLPASGSSTIAAPSSTTTFTLTAMGTGNGSATATAVLQVNAPHDIRAVNHIVYMVQENRSFDHYFARMNTYRVKNQFSTSMTDVDTLDNPQLAAASNPADTSAFVSWSTTGAATVTLNGVATTASGIMNVSPSTTTMYTVTATNAMGSATASLVVGVTPDSGSRILAGASPTSVAPGGSALLSWGTTDGSSVTISPAPDPQHTLPYGPNARTPVKPSTTTTYTITPSNSAIPPATVTVTVATPLPGSPSASITDLNQGHTSQGAAATVSSFLMPDQCTEDFSPDWLESHGAYNRDDPASNTFLGNGFVHIGGGFAQNANAEGAPFHYFDVRGARAMGFFDDSILPYYYFMAAQFGISDKWYSPVPTNSPSNRLYALAATSKGRVHADTAFLGNTPTIFDRLQAAGISWKVYYSDISLTDHLPNTTLRAFDIGNQHPEKIVPVNCAKPTTPCGSGQTDYFTDLKNGTLPQVALIEPGFDSGLDEHPGNDVQSGAAYVASIINALMASSSWKDSVFVLTWDEGGGLFDHAQPATAIAPDSFLPSPPSKGGDLITHFDGSQWVDKDAFTMCNKTDPNSLACVGFTRTGFRLPVIVISPFSKKHFVWHPPSSLDKPSADNTAILTFIEKRFNLTPLTARDGGQPDMSDFLDFTAVPWSTPPANVPVQPTNAPCFQKRLF